MIGSFFEGMSAPAIWALLAMVLASAELFVPGVFLIWLAIAAALTAVVDYLVPMNGAFQMLTFSVLSALSVSGGRLWYLARPATSSDPMLNDRAARLIGRTVTVSEAIVEGQGRVRIDDSSWRATGPDAPTGARMTVVDVEGATLVLERAPD
jgi:membrane protein implicated in regulation of membrane protease activity